MFSNMPKPLNEVGAYNETTLWEGTITTPWTGGNLPLNDDLSKYDKLRIYSSTPNTAPYNVTCYVEVEVSRFLASQPYFLAGFLSSSAIYAREFVYNSNTSITFGNCYRLNVASTGANSCIPSKIVGLKATN